MVWVARKQPRQADHRLPVPGLARTAGDPPGDRHPDPRAGGQPVRDRVEVEPQQLLIPGARLT